MIYDRDVCFIAGSSTGPLPGELPDAMYAKQMPFTCPTSARMRFRKSDRLRPVPLGFRFLGCRPPKLTTHARH
jgi:hypothetical protein